MTTERKSKKPDIAWLLAILVPVIFIYAANRWLNTSDGYRQYEITGKEVIQHLPHFWAWVIVGIIGCLVFLGLAFLNETGIWIGKRMKGSTGTTLLYCILALACLISPWFRAMGIKANGGVDIPKTYKTQHYENMGTAYSSTAGNTCSYLTNGLPAKG